MAGLEETSSGPQADGLTQLAPAAGSGPWTKALLGDGDEEADAAMLDAIAPRPTSADLGADSMPQSPSHVHCLHRACLCRLSSALLYCSFVYSFYSDIGCLCVLQQAHHRHRRLLHSSRI